MAERDVTIRHLLPGSVDLGFTGGRVRRLDVTRTAEGWSIAAVLEREGGPVRCAFRDVQWVQMAGTWSGGLAIAECCARRGLP